MLEPAYDLTRIDCKTSEGSSAIPHVDDGTVDVITAEEGTVECTFTYTQRGGIIVAKQTLPDGDLATFNFTGEIITTLGDGVSDSKEVTPGQHAVTETVPAGWDLTGIVCDDLNSSGDIVSATAAFEVEAGEIVTCIFTNTKRGHIVVDKVTDPSDDSQVFSFTASGGTSPAYVSFTLTDAQNVNDQGLKPGSYSVSETALTGWDLTSTICVSSIGDTETAGSLELDAGETITCTFTNIKRGQIFVEKQVVSADPAAGAVAFTFTPSWGAQFLVSVDGGPVGSELLVPSTYSVSETVPAGWDQTSSSCSDGSAVNAISLQAGETVTCTFTNTHLGQIIVIKDAAPDDPQDFSFDFSQGGSILSSFQLDDDASVSKPKDAKALSNTETIMDLMPGDFTVGEAARMPTAWELTGISCISRLGRTNDVDATVFPTALIALAAGDTITCTFTNIKRANIEVYKMVDPNLDASLYTNLEIYSQLFDFTLEDVPPENGIPHAQNIPSAVNEDFQLADGDSFTTDDPDFVPGPGLVTGDYLYSEDGIEKTGTYTYSVKEHRPDGWYVMSLDCVSSLGTSTWDIRGAEAFITLGTGDTVSCTYVNSTAPHIGTQGFWRNWDNHYTEDDLALLLRYTGATSDVTGSASASQIMTEIYDFSGGHSLEQGLLAELLALELNLSATALSESDPAQYGYLLQQAPSYPGCIVKPYSITGEYHFYRGELSLSDLTIGEVVTRIEGSWSGADPMTLDTNDWAFDLTTAWSFEQSDATLTYDDQLILITNVLSGINHGYLLIPNPDSYNNLFEYPNGPTCLQSGSYSETGLTSLDTLASLYDGTFDQLVSPNASSLAEGTLGRPYSVILQAGGGTPPYRWEKTGALPAGLRLDAGVISGTPSAAGTYVFTLKVTDTALATDSREYSITINPLPVIATDSPLAGGSVGVDYGPVTLKVQAGTGTPGYTWRVISRKLLPSGLNLSPNGVISGTPTDNTNRNGVDIEVEVEDSNGAKATKVFNIFVSR